LSFFVGVYVFFSGIRTTNPQRFVVVLVALAFALAAAVGFILFARDLERSVAGVGGTVAIAVLGAVIGAYEFWYQNQYIPTHASSDVALNVSLSPAGEHGDFLVVRAKIGYESIGGKSVSAVGSVYTLTGSKVVRCNQSVTVGRVGTVFRGSLLDPQRIRFMANVFEFPPTVLAAGKFVADGKRLDPNVPASRGFVFLVPSHRYQLLRFRAQLFAIPGSIQLSPSTPPITLTFPGDNELYEYWHVQDDSWAHALISGRERWVVVRYELVDPANFFGRHRPASAVPVSSAIHVLASVSRPTWSRGLPSARATLRLFNQSALIPKEHAAAVPADASEQFADTELVVNRVTATC
jgi:hypothetical protein